MKILDTTFLIDLLRGKEDALKIINDKERLFTTQINMYEVIRGLMLKKISSSKMSEINEMFESIKVLSLDDSAIVKAAGISSDLIKKGIVISDCDCLTAGIALSKSINKIVTKNSKHFSRIKGIEVLSY